MCLCQKYRGMGPNKTTSKLENFVLTCLWEETEKPPKENNIEVFWTALSGHSDKATTNLCLHSDSEQTNPKTLERSIQLSAQNTINYQRP